jgi:deoxyribonuclease V
MTSATKAVLDVAYAKDGSRAVAACVCLKDWTDSVALCEHTAVVAEPAPYVSGSFFQRELPCLLRVLAALPHPCETIIIDGHVDLDDGRPGLGRHLFDSLGQLVPVIGVAKTPFRGAVAGVPTYRGSSLKALYVSSAGLDLQRARKHIVSMFGAYRLPTLVRRADRLCRDALDGLV